MATYQLVFTRPSGGQSSNLASFPDDATAIADTKTVLDDQVLAIAPVCETEWLGVWDWNDGDPTWTPDSET